MVTTMSTNIQEIQKQTEAAYRHNRWQTVPIKEDGDPLIKVGKEFSYPWYAKEMRLTTDEHIHLRASVYKHFLDAAEQLNRQGYSLRIYDGWRSKELQEKLYWHYLRIFTAPRHFPAFNRVLAEFAGLSTIAAAGKTKGAFEALLPEQQEEINDVHTQYVSFPSDNPVRPAPHSTGGAIDVWLYDNYGRPCDLGVPFDWMTEEAGAFYHLQPGRAPFGTSDVQVCYLREMLITAMVSSGFSVYLPEFWHFNFGNQMDAMVKGETARYGYIEPLGWRPAT